MSNHAPDSAPTRPGDVATGKVVLVTGASSGIGEAVATRLVGEGHTVVGGARRLDRLDALGARLAGEPGRFEADRLEITDAADTTRFVQEAQARHGRVDAVVANAGVMPLSRLDALRVDEWDRMIDVNVRGLLHTVAAVLPVFTAQDSGHVVTIASVGAHEVPETSAVYSGTKFAQWAITEGLRVESPAGIRVTTVNPGVTESELADSITDPYAAQGMVAYRSHAIPADAVARVVSFALAQPADVDVNEVTVRPAGQR